MAQSSFELFPGWDGSKNSLPIAFLERPCPPSRLNQLLAREAIGAESPWCITRKTGLESAELPGVEPLRAQRKECYQPRPFGVLCTSWCLIIVSLQEVVCVRLKALIE